MPRRRQEILIKVCAVLLLLTFAGGVTAGAVLLPVVKDSAPVPVASPAVLGAFVGDGAVTTVDEWRERRAPALRSAFERDIYGSMPDPVATRIVSRTLIDMKALRGLATLEQLTVELGQGPTSTHVGVLLMTPDAPGPHGLILMQNFCGNRAAVPGWPTAVTLRTQPPGPCLNTAADRLVRLVFGRHANAPPWVEIARRGHAAASFYAGDVVPDESAGAEVALARLQPDTPPSARGGAIALWAWSYSRIIDVFDADPRLDPARTAVWGHSRNAKAALLAAAFDPRIELVIAHQSGRGGAALNRSLTGERVAQITARFPHWFGARYASFAEQEETLSIDQHQLIALIAPRPVLLGAARRDAWADPAAAFAALRGAQPAYVLQGSTGLKQASFDAPALSADLAAFMRPGRHGIHALDWSMFLDFVDAHFTDNVLARRVSPSGRH